MSDPGPKIPIKGSGVSHQAGPEDLVLVTCPPCTGTGKLFISGYRPDCSYCEGAGKVWMKRGRAEADQKFFTAVSKGDV